MARRLCKSLSAGRFFGTSAFPGTSQAEVSLGNSFKGRSRFYKDVEVRPLGPEGKPEGFAVLLDGRRVKTGRGLPLPFPTENLAYVVAAEWARQKKILEPTNMPLYGFSSVSTQTSHASRELTQEHIMGYLSTDTACIRVAKTEALPLFIKQQQLLDPFVDWFKQHYGPMEVTQSLFAPPIAEETQAVVFARLQELDDWHLTAVEAMTRTCKSCMLALAVLDRHLTAEQALEMSRTEEQHQIDSWGLLHNGHDLDINFARMKMLSSSSFLWCIDNKQSPLCAPLKHSSALFDIDAEDADAIDDLFLDDVRDGTSTR